MQKLDNLVLYAITVAPDGVIQRKHRLIDIINSVSEILDLNINEEEINKSIMNLKRENKIEIQHIESITGDYKYNKYISTDIEAECLGSKTAYNIPRVNADHIKTDNFNDLVSYTFKHGACDKH